MHKFIKDFNSRFKRILITLVVFSILSSNCSALASASPPRKSVGSAAVYIPAVIMGKGWNTTIIVKCIVNVSMGKGNMIFDGKLETDRLFRDSAKAAVLSASLIYGFDPYAYDYTVSLYSNETVLVHGPSGSTAVAAAIVSAVKGIPLNESIIATGMINLDGAVGFVSYVREKAEGVAEKGFEKFLYPWGQDVQRITDKKVYRFGVYPFTEERLEKIPLNLTELGVEVSPVSSLNETIYRFSGFSLPVGNVSDNEIEEIAEKMYGLLLLEVLGNVDNVRERVRLASQYNRRILSDAKVLLGEAEAIVSLSKALINENKSLAAVEVLLQALSRVKYLEYLSTLLLNNYVSEIVRRDIQREILTVALVFNETAIDAVEDLELKSYAGMLLRETEKAYYYGDLMLIGLFLSGDKIYEAARDASRNMAKAVVLTKKATILLNMANSMNGGFHISEEEIREVAGKLMKTASTMYDYALEVSIAGGIRSPMPSYAMYNLLEARKEAKLNSMASMAYALESIAYSTTLLSIFPSYADVTELRTLVVRDTAYLLHNRTKNILHPVIPKLYIDYVHALNKTDAKIMSLERAIAYLFYEKAVVETRSPDHMSMPSTVGGELFDAGVKERDEEARSSKIPLVSMFLFSTPFIISLGLKLNFM